MTQSNLMLMWALRYLKAGLSIIPLKPKSKEPLIDWKELQIRKPTEKEVKKWFTTIPTANIGIVTGGVSFLVVLDADGPAGLNYLHTKRLNSTAIVFSGKGKHLYFKWKDGLRNSASKIADNVDIRAEGGYVLAPPSIHPTGIKYRWLNPYFNLKSLPEFPTELFAAESMNTANYVDVDKKQENWISEALEDMRNGHIHNTLVSVLGKFRYHNFSMRDTIALLKPYAYENGKPFEGLEAKVEEIWSRYEPSTSKFNFNSSILRSESSLIIHTPGNPHSLAEYERHCKLPISESAKYKTGFIKLDSMFSKGLESSRLFTVAARTGTGKTNWLLAISRSFCEAGRSVLFFSTEMPYTEIWSRYRATLPNPETFKQHKFYVCDSFTPSLEKVEEAINQIKPDLFIFDHINHISEDQKELGNFMQGLNYLKRKYNCIGIVSAQLNRQADWVDVKTGEKITPRMSMIKGSGTIEQASSRVLLLSETKVLPEYTEIVGNLDKNDDGTKGLVYFGLFNNPWRIEELQ